MQSLIEGRTPMGELLEAMNRMFIDWQWVGRTKHGFAHWAAVEEYGMENCLFVEVVRAQLDQMNRAQAHYRRRQELRQKAAERVTNLILAWSFGRNDRFAFFGRGLLPARITYAEAGRQAAGIIAAQDLYGAFALLREVHDYKRLRDKLQAMFCDKLAGFEDVAATCAHCGRVVHIDDTETALNSDGYGVWICAHCDGLREYRWSEHDDAYVHDNNAIPVYESARAFHDEEPTGWAHRYSGNMEGYHFLHSHMCYVSDGAYVELMEDEVLDDDNQVIGSYHSSKRVVENPVRGEVPLPLLGMELEVEVIEGRREDKARAFLRTMRHITWQGRRAVYCSLEHDGSLHHGFEMVTAPCTLDVHAEQLKKLDADLVRGLKSHDTTTCGLHVHIDKAGTTRLHRGKMVAFINDPANRRLIEAVARRYGGSSGFARFKKKTIMDNDYSNDRYEAVNLTNQKTIEFRIFKGTLRYESIMACLEFTKAVWHFTRDAGFGDLTTQRFLEFVGRPEQARETRYLRQILFERKLFTCNRPPVREATAAAVEA